MEIIALVALLTLLWLCWQLLRARKFTQFKRMLQQELKPKVAAAIAERLQAQRCERFPNNDVHIRASQYFWTQYPVRTLQAALQYGIIDEQWLKKTGHWRDCQHLFFVQRQFKVESRDNEQD